MISLTIKLLLLQLFLILPLIPQRKRKLSGAALEEIAKNLSEYGVSENGEIAIIKDEEEKKYH